MRGFVNREDAGEKLGERLRALNLQRPVVLGIPRGGIPIAVAIARVLEDAEVGVVVARKLGAPEQPELAVGAIASNGAYYLDEPLAHATGATNSYLAMELQREKIEAQRREERFNSHRRPPLGGRNVIVVDDGVATGATAIAAIRAMRQEGADFVCFAAPVGSPRTTARLREEADEVVCLLEPEEFRAVGQFYADFDPVEDDEALRLLASVDAPPRAATGSEQVGPARRRSNAP
jgi:putative phosphoribosyl transferase